jgi:hypothetical protein
MDAAAVLKYGHQEILRGMEGLDQNHWMTDGVCGVWSVKDILAHLVSYELLLQDVFNSTLGTAETPILNELFQHGPYGFNDVMVDRYKNKSTSEIWADYLAAYDTAMGLAEKIPAAKFAEVGTISWYGNEYSLDDLMVYQYYGHKREHIAQVNVFRDTLK